MTYSVIDDGLILASELNLPGRHIGRAGFQRLMLTALHYLGTLPSTGCHVMSSVASASQ